jgi:hypothetical protein
MPITVITNVSARSIAGGRAIDVKTVSNATIERTGERHECSGAVNSNIEDGRPSGSDRTITMLSREFVELPTSVSIPHCTVGQRL